MDVQSFCAVCFEPFVWDPRTRRASVPVTQRPDGYFVHAACEGNVAASTAIDRAFVAAHKAATAERCDLCGGIIMIGDWPFCAGDPHAHTPAPNFGEDPLEPYDDFNLTPGTVRVTTRSERRRIMNKNHLEYVPKAKRRGAVTYVDLAKR